MEKYELPDVQQQRDGFPKRAIKKVGVRLLKLPFYVTPEFQTVAIFSSYCNLVPELKGINMSRIGRTLMNEASSPTRCGFKSLVHYAKVLQKEHETDNIYVKAVFDYCFKASTPQTGLPSKEPVVVTMEVRLLEDKLEAYLTVDTVEYSVCPCSKEMSLLINNLTDFEWEELQDANLSSELLSKIQESGFGAHSQKSYLKVRAQLPIQHIKTSGSSELEIDSLVDLLKESSSCSTLSILKRPDEKYVTEVGYMGSYVGEDFQIHKVPGAGPKFVEDICRQVAEKLDEYIDAEEVISYEVVVNNDESIHSGDLAATAVIEYHP